MNALLERLGIRHPIVQGPFGGGLSSVELTAAVSNAGGLGSYGAHELSPRDLEGVIAELRAQTANPFNINLWVSRRDAEAERLSTAMLKAAHDRFAPLYARLGLVPPPLSERTANTDTFTFEQQVDVILALKPAVFSFVFGIPDVAILRECRRRGIVTLGTATTPEESRALEAAGVDAIVATGCEAGGHRPSFLRRAEESLEGTLSLVPRIVDAVGVPVIAAGGIADARGLRAAFRLGARAAQIGTAFLACEESGCSAPHRAALFSPKASRTRLSRQFTGRLARFMVNPLLDKLESHGSATLPFPRQADWVRPLKAHAIQVNDPDLMPLYAGQAAPLLRHRHAAHLMAELVEALRGGDEGR
jgi:nitronate monooxygenase